jgi:hypothetical protein
MAGYIGYRGIHVGGWQVLDCVISLVDEQRADTRASDARESAGDVHGSGLDGIPVDRLVGNASESVRHARPTARRRDGGHYGNLHGGHDGMQRFENQCSTAIVIEQRSQ